MDGIRGSGVAVRALPADIVSVSIHIAEPIGAQVHDDRPDESAVLKALEAAGLKVLETSKLFQSLGGPERASYFSPSKSAAKGGTGFHSQLTLRVSGFKHFTDVLHVLERSGVRQFSPVLLSSSQADGIRDELEQEAIEKAIKRAQSRAQIAGVKVGGAVDLTVGPTRAPGTEGAVQPSYSSTPSTVAANDEFGAGQTLFGPEREGELPLIKYAVAASVVLAAKLE
jgi:uncharacterized protein YggE